MAQVQIDLSGISEKHLAALAPIANANNIKYDKKSLIRLAIEIAHNVVSNADIDTFENITEFKK